MKLDDNQRQNLQNTLLDWYGRHKRTMPWRAPSGVTPDPYHVWLSEIMLQQTTVTAVKPYFEKFIARWPSVHDLAAAENDDVMQMWAGLGYYARARNLHKCAKIVSNDLGGVFPNTVKALLDLPGVGPYTAAAVSSIAFNNADIAVDGNVERVVARFFAITEPMPTSKPELKATAEDLGADNPAPSDFTQAFMELGATICTPKSPKCVLCPWREDCKGLELGIADTLPAKLSKKAKPKRTGRVFYIVNDRGDVLVRKRKDKGLLGGMVEFPSFGWSEEQPSDKALMSYVEGMAPTKSFKKVIKHVFTHFELTLDIVFLQKSDVDFKDVQGAFWSEKPRDLALPSVMMKVDSFIQKSV